MDGSAGGDSATVVQGHDGPGDGGVRRVRIERMLPLYEAKMMGAYDHRSADVVKSLTAGKRQNQPRYLSPDEHRDPWRSALPLAWVPEGALPQVPDWLAGFSDVTSATNERTVISGVLPRAGVGHTYPLYLATATEQLLAAFNSLVLDYAARQKVAGLHLTYGYVKQFPVPDPQSVAASQPFTHTLPLGDWLRPRVLELTYTAWDMAPFAQDQGDIDPTTGAVNPPFIWDDERRSWLRAELDAAFFHLYGIDRDDVDYILDTFPIVRRHDEEQHGEYRTKNRILAIYDAMSASGSQADGSTSGAVGEVAASVAQPYRSVLDPAPGEGLRHERSSLPTSTDWSAP